MKEKIEELVYLSKYSDQDFNYKEVNSCFDIISNKVKISKNIFMKQVSSNYFPRSNLEMNIKKIGELEFSYQYWRQGISIIDESLHTFYPYLKESYSGLENEDDKGYFTQSGQSSTFFAYSFLNNLFEKVSFIPACDEIYFETRLLSRLYNNDDGSYNVLVIDPLGIISLPCQISKVKDCDAVIFDTTALSLKSKELNDSIKALYKSKKPIVLVRSCIKFDCLGTEYSGLGTINFLNFSINLCFKEFIKKDYGSTDFVTFLNRYVASSGILADPNNLYPFYWDKQNLNLNHTRQVRIKENFDLLYQHCLKVINKDNFILNAHKLFIVIKLDKAIEQFHLKVSKARDILNEPIYACDSYSHDYISLLQYESKDKEGNTNHYLRVSSFDLPIQNLENITKYLASHILN